MEQYLLQIQAFIQTDVFIKLSVSFLLAAILGIERDVHGRSAGLRTHILVSIGATLYMIIAQSFPEAMNVDPTRVAGQIVTGIGFLGAGVIIKTGINVRGLTTAAAIWVDAAIGTAIGVGLYVPAIIVTVFSLFVLTVLNRVEMLYPKTSIWKIKLELSSRNIDLNMIRALIIDKKVKIIYMEYTSHSESNQFSCDIRCKVKYCKSTYQQLERVSNRLINQLPDLISHQWLRQ